MALMFDPTKKIGPEKMTRKKILNRPFKTTGHSRFGGVATGDGVYFVLEMAVMTKQLFFDQKNFEKLFITRTPGHPQT